MTEPRGPGNRGETDARTPSASALSRSAHAMRAVARVLVRVQATRGRLALAVAVAVAIALTAAGVGTVAGDEAGMVTLLRETLLGLGIPLVALVFASGCLGDLLEDETLVYVWLRPVPRWALALAAWTATVVVVVPLNLLTAAGATLAGGAPGLLLPALASTALVSLAYVAVFVALGLRTKRSLLWGLGYVLLLEGFLSRLSQQLAAVSLRRYAGSLLDALRGAESDVSVATSVVILAAVTGVGVAATARWLGVRDVP